MILLVECERSLLDFGDGHCNAMNKKFSRETDDIDYLE